MAPHRRFAVLVTLIAAVVGQSCYHYRVAPPGPERPATEWQGETGHAFFWGLIQDPNPIVAEDCGPSGALYDVRATTNFGYVIVAVITLGMWVPLDVEWRCAKRPSPVPTPGPAGDDDDSPFSRAGK